MDKWNTLRLLLEQFEREANSQCDDYVRRGNQRQSELSTRRAENYRFVIGKMLLLDKMVEDMPAPQPTTSIFDTMSLEEKTMILAATGVCVPTGGGSAIHNLHMGLRNAWRSLNLNEDRVADLVRQYADNVITDAEEAGVVERVTLARAAAKADEHDRMYLILFGADNDMATYEAPRPTVAMQIFIEDDPAVRSISTINEVYECTLAYPTKDDGPTAA